MDKASLRKQLLARRSALSLFQRQDAEQKILTKKNIEFFIELQEKHGKQLGIYWPIKEEFDLRSLLSILAQQNFELSLPVMLSYEKMVFRKFDLNQDQGSLQLDYFKLLAPPATFAEVIPDILLMPLCGFDSKGGRLGYGAGCYDRYLQEIDQVKIPFLVGIGFACQEVEYIKQESHDYRLNAIITENGLRIFEI